MKEGERNRNEIRVSGGDGFESFGRVQDEADRLAGAFQHALASRERVNPRGFGVGGNVFPAAAEIGFAILPDDFQENGPAQFSHSFAAPMLTVFGQIPVSVVGRVYQLVGLCRHVLHAEGNQPRSKAAQRAGVTTVERIDDDVPIGGDFLQGKSRLPKRPRQDRRLTAARRPSAPGQTRAWP